MTQNLDSLIYKDSVDVSKYILVRYHLVSTISLADAAWNLAIGQSVGNPSVRSNWETDELFEAHSCVILGTREALSNTTSGEVVIGFPVVNFDFKEDGVSHLLCQVMGGQLDIDSIRECRLVSMEFPDSVKAQFLGPKFGIKGIKEFLGVPQDKPVIGAIIKPKTGITPDVLLEMTKELVEGGAQFIKEDEILANPAFCSLKDRIPLITDYLKGKKVVYAFSITGDPAYVLDRVKLVHSLGGNAVHINFWSGLGIYKNIRELDLPVFVHFQKSGDKILTNEEHAFHIDWNVICQLATMMGADFIHAGMWGGYKSDNEEKLSETVAVLQTGGTMPALSCGLHPGLVQAIVSRFGPDLLLNAGGAVHGHPGGTVAGIKALRQATDGETDGSEYLAAVAKWGIVS